MELHRLFKLQRWAHRKAVAQQIARCYRYSGGKHSRLDAVFSVYTKYSVRPTGEQRWIPLIPTQEYRYGWSYN